MNEPGGLDRPLAEMAEVGIERLGAGHRQEHRAERDEADDAVVKHERHGIERIERAAAPPGCRTICGTAAIAITANQTHMIGPNNAATRAVPRDCTANSTTRMTTVIGTT